MELWRHRYGDIKSSYLQMGHFNLKIFITRVLILWEQLSFYQTNYLQIQNNKRMIPHHSTALTTTNKLIENEKVKRL